MSFAMGSGKGSDVRTTVRFVRNVESSSMLADCGTRVFAFEISARMYSDSLGCLRIRRIPWRYCMLGSEKRRRCAPCDSG